MAITFNETTNMYTCDSGTTGVLSAVSVVLERIIFVPNAADDDLVFIPASGGEDMIVLKAGASDASPINIDWPEGKHVPKIYLKTIGGGTCYVYLR